MTIGILFDIKELAVFDGHGIRTTVFMKGCPMRCNWCHNPEGLKKEPEYLKNKDGSLRLCGEEWSVQALCDRLGKGAAFFNNSGGGVTFSGGEPLWQWPFVKEVTIKMDGFHMALETAGYVPDGIFQDAMELFDLILMDIKCMDSRKHKVFTGVGNEAILRHVRMLCKGDTPFVIRLPLIPGVNDSREDMEAIADVLRNAPYLTGVEMLPYHQTAGAKYEMAGMRYAPAFDTKKPAQAFTESFTSRGIPIQVL